MYKILHYPYMNIDMRMQDFAWSRYMCNPVTMTYLWRKPSQQMRKAMHMTRRKWNLPAIRRTPTCTRQTPQLASNLCKSTIFPSTGIQLVARCLRYAHYRISAGLLRMYNHSCLERCRTGLTSLWIGLIIITYCTP